MSECDERVCSASEVRENPPDENKAKEELNRKIEGAFESILKEAKNTFFTAVKHESKEHLDQCRGLLSAAQTIAIYMNYR